MEIETPAIRAVWGAELDVTVVRTERPGDAEESAALQGIALGQSLRTIVVRRGRRRSPATSTSTCRRTPGWPIWLPPSRM